MLSNHFDKFRQFFQRIFDVSVHIINYVNARAEHPTDHRAGTIIPLLYKAWHYIEQDSKTRPKTDYRHQRCGATMPSVEI
ncbi:hypothetical protein CUU80_07210 [Bifidobacterium scaligerum]|uniref:Uncharacterized protein n=1 Tax=Bifidobacterium scaligerum TaxID=2052656 RepID=A0A2M9HPL4_9BIFI|nr:hypothetical protein CUU80_07210 [Bifidobacterium scaligerum]